MMNLMRTRAVYYSTLGLAIFSILLTRIPLFNYLGFEFSFVIAGAGGYSIGLLTMVLWKRQSIQTKNELWRFILQVCWAAVLLLSIPFLIAAANAFIIKNCSISNGITFYALLVLPGAIFSESLAVLTIAAFTRWHKTAFSFFFVCVLLHIPFVTYFYPQNFAYNPIVGFFPGFSYDESMHVTKALVLYRILTIILAILLFSVAGWFWQFRQTRRDPDQFRSPNILLELTAIALMTPLLMMMFVFSDRLGFSSSESYIKQKLGGSYRTKHIDIYYPTASYTPDAVEQLGDLHEFYYQRISTQLHVAPSWRLSVYIYGSPDQKGKLIGAAMTDITKPWLHQIHINVNDIEAALKHEMVHALAADLNTTFMHAPMNSGLVEGSAVAFGDAVWCGEPLDHAVALIFAAGEPIQPEHIFTNTGFFRSNAGVSYAVAGSFCKYLYETYGVEKFQQVYASGDIAAVYRHDLSSLVNAWKQNILRRPLTSADSMKARFYFKRSSIFEKDCARVLANQNENTKMLLAQHHNEEALVSAERSLALHKTPEAVFQKVLALYELQRYADVTAFCRMQFTDSLLAASYLPLRLRMGDAYWALDSFPQAKAAYQDLASFGFGTWYVEDCALRLEALASPEAHMLRTVLILSCDDTVRRHQLQQIHVPLAYYLLGREQIKLHQYADAEKTLESISFTQNPLLEYFRLQRLGAALFLGQESEKARAVFLKARAAAPTESFRIEISKWLQRCDFIRQ